jgi:hypothetical protein
MKDLNNNGIPDDVEIAAANAARAREDAKKAEAELARAQLPYQVPLYDRVIMRLVVPFCLAFAAPAATYYFSQKASAGLSHVERLDRAVERLERIIVQRELRQRAALGEAAEVSSSDDPFVRTPMGDLVDEFIQQEKTTNLDEFLEQPQAKERLRQMQEQR